MLARRIEAIGAARGNRVDVVEPDRAPAVRDIARDRAGTDGDDEVLPLDLDRVVLDLGGLEPALAPAAADDEDGAGFRLRQPPRLHQDAVEQLVQRLAVLPFDELEEFQYQPVAHRGAPDVVRPSPSIAGAMSGRSRGRDAPSRPSAGV